ncbi:putative Beta-grasp domain-containing protein [Lupinus albus]|uniref:Putative Beta-grasp domain-containing protein n=1 Tax=Lupinus albus TaxID=3870 RepID=A0A6A4QYG3_LUPAL|nr:putative Beta-grasp domain-containing protein [Lupinus albus]
MATFHLAPFPSFTTLPSQKPFPSFHLRSSRSMKTVCSSSSYKVVVEHEGKCTELQVEADESILSKALDSGLSVPHDCSLGVSMTCPARNFKSKRN